MAHCSGPTVDLSDVYIGSSSIRGGMYWLVFGAFDEDDGATFIDFVERIGVERLMDGRLKAAGLMSTIFESCTLAMRCVYKLVVCNSCGREEMNTGKVSGQSRARKQLGATRNCNHERIKR
jgi:hypothetical protein